MENDMYEVEFELDYFEIEWIRANLDVIEVEDIPEELIELLPELH